MIRYRLYLSVVVLIFLAFLVFLGFHLWRQGGTTATPANAPTVDGQAAAQQPLPKTGGSELAPTIVNAHNLMLRKGPSFRIYVRWLRGKMTRSKRNVNPTFDDPDSFVLDVPTGVLRANIGDLTNFLNASTPASSHLKNMTLSGNGDQVKLKATLHKIVPLPIEVDGILSVAPGNFIQLHVTKINVLKIPFKALLGGLHISVADLFDPQSLPGVQVSGNDSLFDTQKLLPPPHIRGELTQVRIANPDLEEVFGDAKVDIERVEQWRNFLRLSGGTIDFGKLTMRHVDLIMIDISDKAWFDLDLNHYQDQLVNGYTRMTPQAGLQIFMPDLSDLPPSKTAHPVSIEWLKNRNLPPPQSVYSK